MGGLFFAGRLVGAPRARVGERVLSVCHVAHKEEGRWHRFDAALSDVVLMREAEARRRYKLGECEA